MAFTDFHGSAEAYCRAKQLIASEKPDFVVVGGDLANHDAEKAKYFLLDLANAGRSVYFVPGNMDGIELKAWPGGKDVRPLHGQCESWEDICLIGLGGSPFGPLGFSEEKATVLLNEALGKCAKKRLILVSHCPPKDTKIDRVFSGEHVGSTSVRTFVERVQPVFVVSGHIHEAQGTDTIGSSVLVNTGPAQRGYFARIVLKDRVAVAFGKLF